MDKELWAIEAKATGYTDHASPRKVFDLAHNREAADKIAKGLNGRGYRVFAWDMSGKGGRFDLQH